MRERARLFPTDRKRRVLERLRGRFKLGLRAKAQTEIPQKPTLEVTTRGMARIALEMPGPFTVDDVAARYRGYYLVDDGTLQAIRSKFHELRQKGALTATDQYSEQNRSHIILWGIKSTDRLIKIITRK